MDAKISERLGRDYLRYHDIFASTGQNLLMVTISLSLSSSLGYVQPVLVSRAIKLPSRLRCGVSAS